MSQTWAVPDVAARYNLSPGLGSHTPSELHTAATPGVGAAAAAQPWNPHNPLFWFAGIAALTFGLMAVSTTVRVGPAKVSASLGK